MTSTQYSNVIQWALANTPVDELTNSSKVARDILTNCGMSLPHGDNSEVMQTLMSDSYMGWTSCTHSQAQEYANDGVLAIGVDPERIVIISPDSTAVESESCNVVLPQNEVAQPASNIEIVDRMGMQFFAANYATTSTIIPNNFITVNGWLRLYERPSQSHGGRTVQMPDSLTQRYNWYAFEERTKINKYAPSDSVVNIGSKGELTNEQGRYWVAVGPKVAYPAQTDDKAVDITNVYGTGVLDVVLSDSDGELWYLPAVIGDVKAHTFNNGILQTEVAYLNPNGSRPENAPRVNTYQDMTAIEFIANHTTSNNLAIGLANYTIKKIIFYHN